MKSTVSGFLGHWLLTTLILFVPFEICRAEAVSLQAELSSSRTSVGEAVDLSLSVHGTQEVNPVSLPAIDGVEVRFLGTSNRIVVVNGEYSTTEIFNYELLPLKEGKVVIPALEVTLKGEVYRTEPLVLDVVPASSGDANSTVASSAPQNLAEMVKLLVFLPQKKFYIGEQIPFMARLYVRDVPLDNISLPQIETPGIELGDFVQPRQGEELLDGVRYQVIEFRSALTPLRSGHIQAGPLRVNANHLYKAPQNRGGMFDDAFFGGMFGSYQRRSVSFDSAPFELEVLDLPQTGQPQDFSGAVGDFEFTVDIAPLEVKVGDPVTIKMSLSGTGSYQNLRFPVFKADGFKVYDPVIREQNGVKYLEQVIMPTRSDIGQIPALSFSSFDPVRGEYITQTRGPFPLKVTVVPAAEEFQVTALPQPERGATPDVLGKDIVFIKDSPGKQQPCSSFWGGRPILVVLLIYVFLWMCVYGFLFYRRRLQQDSFFAMRVRAPGRARKRLEEAQKAKDAGDSSAFYGLLSGTLRNFLLESVPLDTGDKDLSVEQMLAKVGIDVKSIAEVKAIGEAADLVRFAGAVFPSEKMDRDLAVVKDVLRLLERRLK